MKNSLRNDELFLEFSPLVEKLGLNLVDIHAQEQHASFQVRLVIKSADRETGIDDCTRVHKLVEPRLTVLYPNGKELNLEVSTPGLQRSFKDFYEFSLFVGSRVKILGSSSDEWVSGVIVRSEGGEVLLDTDNGDITMRDTDIKKAKLEFRWEEKQ